MSCNELIKERWPSPIIFEIGQIASSLLNQVVEQIPRVLRDDIHLTALLPLQAERLPRFQEPALAVLADDQVPQVARKINLNVALTSLLCELPRVLIHRLEVALNCHFLAQSCHSTRPSCDRVHTQFLASFLELFPLELTHVLGLHVVADPDGHDVGRGIDADLGHEALDGVLVHDDLAHLVRALEAVEEGLGLSFVEARATACS